MQFVPKMLRSLFLAVRPVPVGARRAALGTRVNDQGAILDDDTALMLSLEGIHRTPRTDPASARLRLLASIAMVEGPERPVAVVRDLQVAGLPARLYDPGDAAGMMVFFHGGGWVVGDLQSHDRVCRRLAREGGQQVLAIDYRLAPEHRFPTAAEDAMAAFRWARDHAADFGVSPDAIAVGGDSAGGNLAAVVCLAMRRADEAQPAFQLLIYPATDLRRVTPSHRALEEGYLLTGVDLDWYQGHYAPEIYDWRGSPLLVDDHGDLAPAVVVWAGFDPLRDDAVRYAAALRRGGTPVVELGFPGLVHGFVNMDGALPAADRAAAEVYAACRGQWTARIGPPTEVQAGLGGIDADVGVGRTADVHRV